MLKMLKTKCYTLIASHLAGAITGIAVGMITVMIVKKKRCHGKGLKKNMKKAFKTIEDNIHM